MHRTLRLHRSSAVIAGRLIVAGAALAAAVVGCGSAGSPNTLTAHGPVLAIYTSLPLGGADAVDARDILAAERLALSQAGGVAGQFRVRLVAEDDSNPKTGLWDPGLVLANARRAVADTTTIAYVGEQDPGASTVAIPILNESGILEVSPTDSYAGLTQRDGGDDDEPQKYYPTDRRTFVRTVPPDTVEARALAAYMRQLGARRLYVVQDGDFYGAAMARNVAAAAQATGIRLLGTTVLARPQPGDDQRPTATAIARYGPDAIFYGGVPTGGVAMLWRDLAAALPGVRLFGPSTLAQPPFLAALGPAQASSFITTPALPPSSYPAAGQRFFSAFRAAYGRLPRPTAIYGFAAMQLVLAAIADSGRAGNHRATVADAAFHARVDNSVIGAYTIDRAGDPSLAIMGANRVLDGQLQFDRELIVASDARVASGGTNQPGG